MTGFRAFPQTRFFHFHEVAYVSAFQQLSTWTQTRKRTDSTRRVQMSIFNHAVRANFAVVTDDAVFDHTAGANFDAVAKLNVAFKDNVSINLNISPVRQGPAQIETRWIAQHYAGQQQLFGLLRLINALETRKLQTVIHAVRFTDARRMNGGNFTPFVVRHRNDIGDVVLTLRVVVIELRQPALHICAIGNQDTGVDLLNLTLFIAGVFVFNDTRYVAVLTRDTAIARWVVQHDG